MKYEILLTASAEREIRKLPSSVQDDIFEKIKGLEENPRPHGYKRLTNFDVPNIKLKPPYRVRVGDYRVIFAIQDVIITITVVKIAHRKEVYE